VKFGKPFLLRPREVEGAGVDRIEHGDLLHCRRPPAARVGLSGPVMWSPKELALPAHLLQALDGQRKIAGV
jgi:hypothetical protein